MARARRKRTSVELDTAERYGYVNRALPDAELDGFEKRWPAVLGTLLEK